ncbi:MAG: 50S ribosomal protein L16 [Candidatus Altiarchaeota archaeon]|nr:50S ribosomal protein L16 [Candidatus Altiarchaeota archaeon]
MGLRPASCYREVKNRAYTRVAKRVMKKAFIRGVPGPKIQIFDMGNKSKRDWVLGLDMISKQPIQVRHNQLEAIRMSIFRHLNANIGRQNFFFRIRAYPHHVLRENPMATGAGADRFQQGMRKSFGKPIGTAARLKKGKELLSVYLDDKSQIPIVKKAFKIAANKLSGNYSIKVNESVGRV